MLGSPEDKEETVATAGLLVVGLVAVDIRG